MTGFDEPSCSYVRTSDTNLQLDFYGCVNVTSVEECEEACSVDSSCKCSTVKGNEEGDMICYKFTDCVNTTSESGTTLIQKICSGYYGIFFIFLLSPPPTAE